MNKNNIVREVFQAVRNEPLLGDFKIVTDAGDYKVTHPIYYKDNKIFAEFDLDFTAPVDLRIKELFIGVDVFNMKQWVKIDIKPVRIEAQSIATFHFNRVEGICKFTND